MSTTLGLFASLFALLLAPTTQASPVSGPQQDATAQCSHSNVLVLGAGMAGISAGHTLVQQGIDDFKIIEYQDRIGGRTLHTKFGTKPDGSQYTVELGTNWITGLHAAKGTLSDEAVTNPIWKLAQEVNLTTVPDGIKQRCYDRNGRSDWCHLFGEFGIVNARMREHANDRVRHGKDDISVRAGLRLNGWDSTNDLYKQAVEWLIWDADGAAPLDQSSMIFGELSVDADIGPNERFVLDQRGYDLVARHLASKYLRPHDARLILDSPVTNISYSDSGVTVYTKDTCFSADYAICTFSLGVLQQALNGKAPVVFTPPFLSWKRESIATNVMGIYTKTFYQFDRAFWPKDVQYFYYASPTTRGYWNLWESLDFPGSPLEGSGIIFGTLIYEQSMQIEQQSDDKTMREVVVLHHSLHLTPVASLGIAVLRQMFPNATIPEQPLAFLYPRWGMTDWAYGSYSNWAAGYTLDNFVNFRSNLGRLWFAGEATSAEYWGYLHGAYYEGQFAAREIAACLKGHAACRDRKRYTDIRGDPEEKYNHKSGFQDDVETLLHPDRNFHYETIRSLGITRYHGGEISEQIGVLERIPTGDFDAWYREWSGLANRVLQTIDQSKLESYSPFTVRDVYFRAGHYQFLSDFFLHGNQSDPRLRENYDLWRKRFDTGNAHLSIPGRHINIETPHGFTVPAIFYRAAEASTSSPRPLVIVQGDFDSNLEEVYHVFGSAALERGYNVVIFEGPGQLGEVHEQGREWIAEWERVVSPLVDYVSKHKDKDLSYVDTAKIAIIDKSLGGYLAARAAAYEQRLAAVILVDGVWSFEDTFLKAFPDSEDAWRKRDEDVFNRAFEDVSSESTTDRGWIQDHLLFSCRAESGFEAMRRVVKPVTLDGIADKIKMPAFVGLAKNDIFFHGQPEKVAHVVGSNATLVEFGDELSAGAHCASGALTYQYQRVFEWFAGVVGH